MRLINAETRELIKFDGEVPEYAILSHTWEEQEISFRDFMHREPGKSVGFAKIDRCCELVAREGFEYVWIDTCCINKDDNDELSFSINSMYQWYKEAQVCIAYLVDVPSEEETVPLNSAFARSRWFTRGWTLQELIASPIIEFYGRDWLEIGTKLSLQRTISAVTSIPVEVLRTGDMRNISVAERMSWASRRETAREEDMAYCLMGLFDVSMVKMYGEGINAFKRLQEEIIKISNDHSLFAWAASKDDVRDWTCQGLLADSPVDFVRSSQIVDFGSSSSRAQCQMTSLGLCMELPLIPQHDSEYIAVLNCQRGLSDGHFLGIGLRKIRDADGRDADGRDADERYARVNTSRLFEVNREQVAAAAKKLVYVRRHVERHFREQPNNYVICDVAWAVTPSKGHGYRISDIYPESIKDGRIQVKARNTNSIVAALMIENESAERFVVVLGRFGGQPWCDIVTKVGDRDLKTIFSSYSYFGHSDRAKCHLPAGLSALVAIKKRGRRRVDPRYPYDAAYTLYIEFLQTKLAEEVGTA